MESTLQVRILPEPLKILLYVSADKKEMPEM